MCIGGAGYARDTAREDEVCVRPSLAVGGNVRLELLLLELRYIGFQRNFIFQNCSFRQNFLIFILKIPFTHR